MLFSLHDVYNVYCIFASFNRIKIPDEILLREANIHFRIAREDGGVPPWRVFRLIDFGPRVTRLKTRYSRNSDNVWRVGSLSIRPRRLVTRRFERPGKSGKRFLSFCLCRSLESRGKRFTPAKFTGGSFDLWRKFLVAALCRISWSCCSLFSRLPSWSRFLAFLFSSRSSKSPSPSPNNLNPSITFLLFLFRSEKLRAGQRFDTGGRPVWSIFSTAPFASENCPFYRSNAVMTTNPSADEI